MIIKTTSQTTIMSLLCRHKRN